MATGSVLVAGAGPTGLLLTSVLIRLGVPARLIDRDPEPHREARATGLQPRTLEILDRLGIVEGWLREGQKLRATRVRTPDGALLRSQRLDQLKTRYPFMISVQQRTSERLLEEALIRQGGQVERSVELLTLEQDGDGVKVLLRGGGREESSARFDWVVGADGAHSRVRDALLVPVVGGDYASVFACAETEVSSPYPLDEVTVITAPGGLFLLAPLPDRRTLVIATDPAHADGPLTGSTLQELLDGLAAGGIEIREVFWSGRFHTHFRLAERMQIGRVMLAGDAAHVCSPLAGQGLNLGLHDAWNLGWKLALVANGQAPPSLLASYESERRPLAEHALALSDATHRAVLAQDPAWPASAIRGEEAFRGHGEMGERARLLAKAELDERYRDSPIVEDNGCVPPDGLRAGDWFPGRLPPERHHLLAPGGSEISEVLTRTRIPIDAHDQEGEDATLVLVRPDGYIGFASRPADPALLDGYLDRVFGVA